MVSFLCTLNSATLSRHAKSRKDYFKFLGDLPMSKQEELKEQAETAALMDAEVEVATECGCACSSKAEKAFKEEKEQLETEALMDAEVEAATDCGCGCSK